MIMMTVAYDRNWDEIFLPVFFFMARSTWRSSRLFGTHGRRLRYCFKRYHFIAICTINYDEEVLFFCSHMEYRIPASEGRAEFGMLLFDVVKRIV